MKGLHDQITLNDNQFPRSLSEAINILSNKKFDNYKLLKLQENNRGKNVKKNNNNNISTLSFSQVNERCYCYRKLGH